MMNDKILFVLTSHGEKGSTGQKTGYYLQEAAHPWHILSHAGFEIDFVTPQGGEPPVDGFNLEDPINKEFWDNTQVQRKLKNTLTAERVNPREYRAIFYVGGHGTMWDFAQNETLAKIAADIYENGGVVAAVCHGPAGLVNIRLSNGEYLVNAKTVAAFTNAEEEAVGLTNIVPFLLESKLIERGAQHIPAENWQANVQISERLVTGQNPASAIGVGAAMLELLK